MKRNGDQKPLTSKKMKLTKITNIGRFKNKITGREYNIKKGTNKERGTDHYFYLYRNKRVFISDMSYFHNHEKTPNQKS